MGACSCCSGTDCAAMCAQGQCYAEEVQRRQDEEERAEAEWLSAMEEVAQIIAALAIALGDGIRCRACSWSDRAHHPECEVLRSSPIRVFV